MTGRPPTAAPSAISDPGCLAFATSQGCSLSTVECNVASSLYQHVCDCTFSNQDCAQLRPNQVVNGRNYTGGCPCTGGIALFGSTTVFGAMIGVMVIVCLFGMFIRVIAVKLRRRSPKITQDPTTLVLATDHEHASWLAWERAMRDLEENLQRGDREQTGPDLAPDLGQVPNASENSGMNVVINVGTQQPQADDNTQPAGIAEPHPAARIRTGSSSQVEDVENTLVRVELRDN